MTNYFKGALVTFEKEIRDDDIEYIINTLKMIKGVLKVQPYVKNMEDYMSEEKGRIDFQNEIIEFIRSNIRKKWEK